MVRFRSLPVIAIRRMVGNWRLLSSVVIGTVIAAAIVSSTAIYSDAIRDLGLDFALKAEAPADLDVNILQTTFGVDRAEYQRSRSRVDGAVARALHGAGGALVRQGTSATFYPTPPGGEVSTADDRPRANVRFRAALEDHIAMVAGVFPAPQPEPDGDILRAAVGRETAERNGIALGDRFDLFPFWDEDAAPMAVEVVGIVEPLDLDERYWGDAREAVDRRTRSWETILLLVPETSFFGALPQLAEGVRADFDTLYMVETDALDSRNAAATALALRRLGRTLADTEQRVHIRSELAEVLEDYDEKLFFTRLPLLVLLLQIAGIVGYYLVMVSTMLVERQAGEIALLRSRGATTGQLLAQYGVEGGLLAVLATVVGPPLAAAVISLLGTTPAFHGLSGGDFLSVHISPAAYLLAGGGALIAFAALMIPAWRVTHTTVIEFKRAAARPRPTPLFLRYYLDVALVLAAAIVFWQLSQQEQLFTESLFGETQADPFLLLTPAVFLLTVGIVFLRVFPLLLRLVAAALSRSPSVAVLVGMRSLVRRPVHYTRLILLLMFATGVGMFGASFGATLDRSYDDRAAYAVGADVRAASFRPLDRAGEQGFRDAIAEIPVEGTASFVLRVRGRIESTGGGRSVDFVGVEPETFPEVAFFRGDFAPQSLDQMMAALAGNAASLEGAPLPADAVQVGAWVRAVDLRGGMFVNLTLRDADGRYVSLRVAQLSPRDERTGEWQFLSAMLPVAGAPEPPSGGFRRGSAVTLTPPLALHAYYLQSFSAIARAQGTVLLGPVIATAEPSPPARGETFQEGVTVHGFADLAGFEVLSGLRPWPTGDSAVPEPDAPPGFAGSTRLEWQGDGRSPQYRGVRQTTDGEPMLLYLLERTARELEVGVGDEVVVSIQQQYAPGLVAGTFRFFPTLDVDAPRDAYAVANLGRVAAQGNAAPGGPTIAPGEVWYRTDEPAALRAALSDEALGPQVLLDVESEALRQQEDPLVAAGWSGILAIAFGAVLLLSAIGFLVYSYLTAQERALEFAVLRTLGFSRTQVFSLVAFEHVVVIAAGVGLGTIVGLQVGRLMMDFLATDERGEAVLPPFILGVSWPSVFLSWGVLSAVFVATIAAVVLLYLRLAVHRALRIGDA